MSYLFSDSEDVHAAAAFGQEASKAMLPHPSNWMRDRHRPMLPQQAARRAALISRRAQRRGVLPPRPAAISGLGADPTDPHEFFTKYEEKNLRYAQTIETIRSDGARQALRKALAPLTAEYGRIKPAFAPGSTPGARDISRMKTWSDGLNSFSRSLTAALKQYGTGASAPPVTPPPSSDVFVGPRQPKTVSEPVSDGPSPIMLGLAALALLLVVSR